MNIRKNVGPVNCPKCAVEVPKGGLFKVQGQTECMCPACLMGYAVQQGVEKNITLDGIVVTE